MSDSDHVVLYDKGVMFFAARVLMQCKVRLQLLHYFASNICASIFLLIFLCVFRKSVLRTFQCWKAGSSGGPPSTSKSNLDPKHNSRLAYDLYLVNIFNLKGSVSNEDAVQCLAKYQLFMFHYDSTNAPVFGCGRPLIAPTVCSLFTLR